MENFIKPKEKRRNEMCKFSLILWKYHTKISSQFLRVNGVLANLKFMNEHITLPNSVASDNET